MKHCVLLSLLFAWGCVHTHGAPVEQAGPGQGSCTDASALGAAGLALTSINQDRQEGYILSLHRLSNVHMTKHGETGVVYYLTLDVVETNCSVLSGKNWKTCEARPTHDTPVYGQCKAAIYINKVQRVVRLYKYNCVIRPVPAARVSQLCPDCPSHTDFNNPEVQKTVSLSLDKFNKESGLANKFALLKMARATSGMTMSMYYNVEYSIQETTCTKGSEADNCPLMECEFAHKGFCKASHFHTPTGESEVSVECEIFEPEAAEREKKQHLLGGETDHSHSDQAHIHDHHHSHAHDHSHDHGHGHGHDHVHAHHAKAHDHSGDSHNQHHDHKHAHLHEHEHHHHHHDHDHEATAHIRPEGIVRMLPALGQPVTLPSFPDAPAAGPEAGVTLPLKPDPQIPGEMEPTIQAFPTTRSAQCHLAEAVNTLVEKLFNEDPTFKTAA